MGRNTHKAACLDDMLRCSVPVVGPLRVSISVKFAEVYFGVLGILCAVKGRGRSRLGIGCLPVSIKWAFQWNLRPDVLAGYGSEQRAAQ